MGYAFEARDHSEHNHRLPCPPNAMGETDFEAVFNRILEIVAPVPQNEYRGKPMIFVGFDDEGRENVKMIESFFQRFNPNALDLIDVFPLSQLFLEMKQKCVRNGVESEVSTVQLARVILERNPFDNTSDISCQVRRRCSIVFNFTFTIQNDSKLCLFLLFIAVSR